MNNPILGAVMVVLAIVGARPQFIKLAPLADALRGLVELKILHTGQHYDSQLSSVFFEQLGIAKPDYHLGVGSGTHGAQTAAMLAGVEAVLLEGSPELVVVFGDTNSTVAGALAAAKLHVPVAHVEAGLRSYNRRMAEEINRVVTDHVSSLLFAPSESARAELLSEGITRGVHVVGDIMYDAVLRHSERALDRTEVITRFGVEDGRYVLATIHRAENTDDPRRLRAVMYSISSLDIPVIMPLHPRTAANLRRFGIKLCDSVHACEPVGYLSMLRLIQGSSCVITDSGGLQKEAYYLATPCVTMRGETEWPETVEAGWNRLAPAEPAGLQEAVHAMSGASAHRPELYGDGGTSRRIADIILSG